MVASDSEAQPGGSWQDRWLASGAEDAPDWRVLAATGKTPAAGTSPAGTTRPAHAGGGLLALIGADVMASVYCGGTVAATTTPVPFSTTGNARIRTTVSLPAFCPAPAVLLNPATGTSPSEVKTAIYIAFDGTP